ncbi:MAG: hypothetical protein EKK46_06995 [Rhodocyclaceae bacterium]|nr:MAG: hypothetical protein EKK46_06995 [Rhodocyclaceae bacterium]
METKTTCPYCGTGCDIPLRGLPQAAQQHTPLSSPRHAGGSAAAAGGNRHGN